MDLVFWLDLPRGRYATLSGYILAKLHSIPLQGRVIKERDVTLTVHSCTEQRVLDVNI